MPTPFPFVANSVLTAAQLNSISELPTRTLTGSGAAVAADAYSRVILNGTSITYTINTSTFSAGQVVELYNANSTAATIAAGAGVTLNGAAGLTLAQYQTAELYAVSATSFVLWKSDVTQTAAALTLVKTQTIGSAVSSVAVTNVFSSTYDNYLILLTGGTGSAAAGLNMTLGATATGYYFGGANSAYGSASVASSRGSNATSWPFGGSSSLGMVGMATLLGPNLAARTFINNQYGFPDTNDSGNYASGFLNNAIQYTDFTLTPGSGTITGGTIRVYGYANS